MAFRLNVFTMGVLNVNSTNVAIKEDSNAIQSDALAKPIASESFSGNTIAIG